MTFHRVRQGGIDEELFDVISGFEALSKRQQAYVRQRTAASTGWVQTDAQAGTQAATKGT